MNKVPITSVQVRQYQNLQDCYEVGPYYYYLKDHLGTGSFGEVYIARKEQDDQLYAIKIISKEKCAGNPEFAQQLMNEARNMLEMQSEYVIKFFEAMQSTTCYYLVTEYIRNSYELQLWINNVDRIQEGDAMYVFYQIMKGVRDLQKKGITHRDLKPENILYIPQKRSIKIIDLGVAKKFNLEEFNNKNLQSRIGTQLYNTPQHILNLDAIRNNMIDMWSLGIILYQLL